MGRPKHLNDRPEGQFNLRPKGLAKEERRPFLTSTRLSDQKASQRRNSAHFRHRPTSKRPLLPKGLAKMPLSTPTRFSDRECAKTPAYSSSPTGAIRADWDRPTENACSVRTRKRTEKVRQGTQVYHNTKDRTLYTCRTVPYDLPGMTEPKQCCRHRHFPSSVMGTINSHTRQTR